MKLILKFEKDCSSIPSTWCEVCSREITDAGMAMFYWRFSDYEEELHAPLLAHKRCMDSSRSRDGKYDCSMELSTYLAFLLQNVGLRGTKLNEAFESARIMAALK